MIKIREIFGTVQGEGSEAGTPSVFVRFSACNLWNGLETHREKGKGVCSMWCDTDFFKGEKTTPQDVVDEVLKITSHWVKPHVTITGGEPGLQLAKPSGEELVKLFIENNVAVSIETNGTQSPPIYDHPLVHVTVSPKQLKKTVDAPAEECLAHIIRRSGTDLKLVVPQWTDECLEIMKEWDFDYIYLQPMDVGDNGMAAVAEAVRLAAHLGGRISVQTHKMIGLP